MGAMTEAYAARRSGKPAAWKCTDHSGETCFTDRPDIAEYWQLMGLAVTELYE